MAGAPLPSPPGRLATLVRTRPRAWPLSALVLTALTLALLPLGILAVLAAARNYSEVQIGQARLATARLEAAREMARARLGEDVRALRDLALRGVDKARCAEELDGVLAKSPRLRAVARVNAAGRTICSAGSAAPPRFADLRGRQGRVPAAVGGVSVSASVEAATGDLLLLVRDDGVRGLGDAVTARMPEAGLGSLVDARVLGAGDRLELAIGGDVVQRWGAAGAAAADARRGEQRVLGGLGLRLASPPPSVSTTQMLVIALPTLMWLTALAIVWFAIDRIAVDPLARMRRVLEGYAAGDRGARVGPLGLRGQELSDLGQAFDTMADRIDAYAGDMDEALATQRALTREVHHRVKNNLQIVSSLLSLQARDVSNPEVADAYALIRQRVNALSLVHRWMYQEEAAMGVDLRALLADLCANLEHGLEGRSGGPVRLHANVERLFVNQDTALPLAFMVTELAAQAARAAVGEGTQLRVDARMVGKRGELAVSAAVFEGERGLSGLEEGSQRIITGLGRQLRGQLRHDPELGRFALDFATMTRPG